MILVIQHTLRNRGQEKANFPPTNNWVLRAILCSGHNQQRISREKRKERKNQREKLLAMAFSKIKIRTYSMAMMIR